MTPDQSENARRSILVVDDDSHNVRMVGSLLKESGYQVHVADSGELALAIAGEIPLDLILLDILMPGGWTASKPASGSRPTTAPAPSR